MIPHSRPTITREDSEAVARIVATGFIAQGDVVANFERAVASFVGVRGGVAVNTGTSALHLSLLALKVQKGDEIILPSYLCVAPLNAINYVGAVPVLADVDPATGNISPESVRRLLSSRTRAIIVPHMMGQPAAMEALLKLGVPLLEDCAQAIGAQYQGKMVGSMGRLSMCSFYATKVLACGEGGMVLSDDPQLLEMVRDLRDYDEKCEYRVRYNYKMTDMQAALGLSQLQRLPAFIAARQRIAAAYDAGFRDLPLVLPVSQTEKTHIYFRYVLRLGEDVQRFISAMQKEGVICRRAIYKPLHALLAASVCEQAEKLYGESVSIPIYPSLSDRELELVVHGVRKVLQK